MRSWSAAENGAATPDPRALKRNRAPDFGDKIYGGGKGFYLSSIKPGYKSDGEEKPLLDRTAVHAASLTFEHPTTHERMTLNAPLPKDMSSVLKYLRKFKKL